MTNTSPQDFIDFVLKLSSESSGLERSIAVEAVTAQLRGFEQSPFFTDVFTILENVHVHTKTRTLPEYQRNILADAVKSYCVD
ncbi:hypothetical protein J4429_02190 [Candidatus Pacearchaeota archaeon]|nr:hypothetical protein [Candidatus Pacearchaeota archaeon]